MTTDGFPDYGYPEFDEQHPTFDFADPSNSNDLTLDPHSVQFRSGIREDATADYQHMPMQLQQQQQQHMPIQQQHQQQHQQHMPMHQHQHQPMQPHLDGPMSHMHQQQPMQPMQPPMHRRRNGPSGRPGPNDSRGHAAHRMAFAAPGPAPQMNHCRLFHSVYLAAN